MKASWVLGTSFLLCPAAAAAEPIPTDETVSPSTPTPRAAEGGPTPVPSATGSAHIADADSVAEGESPPPAARTQEPIAHAAATATSEPQDPGAAPAPIETMPAPSADAALQPESAEKAVQDANNPLAPVLGFNIQNYFAPALSELPDSTSSALLLRIVSPLWRILPRVTLPVLAIDSAGTSTSGLGDLQVFVAYLLTAPNSKLQFGLGPQYTAPTATEVALGEGKHSLGGAAVVVWVHKQLMLGGLVQLQTSVAGDEARPDATTLWTQAFAILQLGKGYYLRSTPVGTFHLASGTFNVPLGLGAGKVMMIDRSVLNWFAEPQVTFLLEGAGQPLFQLFMGLNYQYKL